MKDHPIWGKRDPIRKVTLFLNGKEMQAFEGEPIAAALMANGIRVFRKTRKRGEPRGVFCAIGRCTDCIMTVDGVPNVRTCMVLVKEGMQIKSERV